MDAIFFILFGMVAGMTLLPHLELADRLAVRYRNAGASLEDLRQTAQAVLLYCFAGLRQQEIADRIGHAQMHVSRLLKRALTAMRDELLSGQPGP